MSRTKTTSILDVYGKPMSYSASTSGVYSNRHSTYLNNASYMRPQAFALGRSIGAGERQMVNRFAKELYRSNPVVGSGINKKNAWAFGSKWTVQFPGNNDWAKKATEYLNDTVLPNCSTSGVSWNRFLMLLANAVDVDGDALLVFVNDGGLPKIKVYPSEQVSSREYGPKTLTTGRYQNNYINDGVIYWKDKVMAYRILGENKDEDKDISVNNSLLVYEPDEFGQLRGLSSIARSVLSFVNISEIEDFVHKTLKIQAKRAVLMTNASGTNEGFSEPEDESDSTSATSTVPVIQDMGEMVFLSGPNGEKLEMPKLDNPGMNTVEFLRGVEEKAAYALGWPLELIRPSDLNEVSARTMEQQINNNIETRQQTIHRVAKLFVLYALAFGMDSGLLPKVNDTSWRQFSFALPEQFVIDSYYNEQLDANAWTIGSKTLKEIAIRKGLDWQTDIRQQLQTEAQDQCERALVLSQQFPDLGFHRALDMISSKNRNSAPVSEQKIESK